MTPHMYNAFQEVIDENLDYHVDWSYWLGGDRVVSSVWEIPPSLTVTEQKFSGNVATVRLDGGVLGITYELTNRIVTDSGRANWATIKLTYVNRRWSTDEYKG